jgi:hypothetical protein
MLAVPIAFQDTRHAVGKGHRNRDGEAAAVMRDTEDKRARSFAILLVAALPVFGIAQSVSSYDLGAS